MTVAGNSMKLNATNVEIIFGTVIEEANKGEIDLNGFSSFWTFIKQQIYASLGHVETELKPSESACEGSNATTTVDHMRLGMKCSSCVCEYRNTIVEETIIQVEDTLELAKLQCMDLFATDLSPYITEFMEQEVLPWSHGQSCGQTKPEKFPVSYNSQDDVICDLSAIDMISPNQPIDLNCSMVFICESLDIDSSEVQIFTEKIFLGSGSIIKNIPPPQAERGADGNSYGDDGKNGSPGIPAFNMKIVANSIIRGSNTKITFISQGTYISNIIH